MRSEIAGSAVAAVMHQVSGSTSQKTGVGAELHDRLGGGEEGERRDHHLVAGTDAERAQADHERVRPVGHPDAVLRADVGGELGLERLDLRAEDVAAALEHRPLPLGDLGQQRLERRAAGEQRQGHRSSLA